MRRIHGRGRGSLRLRGVQSASSIILGGGPKQASAMLSLRAKLHGLGGHLPEGFKASGGIKRLFPKGYAGSITMLKNYVFLFDSGTATDVSSDSGSQISQGQIWMGADGAGRWFLGWWNDDSAGGGWGVNVRYQAGFVFRFSNDGFAHGYVDTSEPDGGATSCNSGVDPWILRALAAGVRRERGGRPPGRRGLRQPAPRVQHLDQRRLSGVELHDSAGRELPVRFEPFGSLPLFRLLHWRDRPRGGPAAPFQRQQSLLGLQLGGRKQFQRR